MEQAISHTNLALKNLISEVKQHLHELERQTQALPDNSLRHITRIQKNIDRVLGGNSERI